MPEASEGSARFTVTLPRAVVARLEAIAAQRGARRAVVMREAAYFYLRHHDDHPQERGS